MGMCERCRKQAKSLREMTERSKVAIDINAGRRRGEREVWLLCERCTAELLRWLYDGGREVAADALRDVPEDDPGRGEAAADGGTDGV